MEKFPSYSETRERLLGIPNKRDRALFCTTYAGMARIGEIVRGRYIKTKSLSKDSVVSFSDRVEIGIRAEKRKKPSPV